MPSLKLHSWQQIYHSKITLFNSFIFHPILISAITITISINMSISVIPKLKMSNTTPQHLNISLSILQHRRCFMITPSSISLNNFILLKRIGSSTTIFMKITRIITELKEEILSQDKKKLTGWKKLSENYV